MITSNEVEPGIAVPDPCEKAHCQASLSCTSKGYAQRTSCAPVQTPIDMRQIACPAEHQHG